MEDNGFTIKCNKCGNEIIVSQVINQGEPELTYDNKRNFNPDGIEVYVISYGDGLSFNCCECGNDISGYM